MASKPGFHVLGVVLIIVLSQCLFSPLSSGELTLPSEVAALRAVRRKLNDPTKRLRSWKNTDPCNSTWAGVLCASGTDGPADGYQHVKELRLLNMNLSGTLAPELGQLSYATVLNFMWNNISGSIPKEIGNMNHLELLLLSGNQISGSLPDELGNLVNLTKFQLDLNNISGELPTSFANLKKAKHFHMNNNSFSGQIPTELSQLPQLVHFLLDNNNLSGYLPPELSKMPSLTVLQLDNNNFNGTEIPDSYRNMSKLFKLSLRNCNLRGSVPDFSSIPGLLYLDLSSNHFTGSIPTNKLPDNMTTIDLSNNKMINGSIPSIFSGLPHLQRLSLENNKLSGIIPTDIWQGMDFKQKTASLTLDFQNNLLSDISGVLDPPSNVSIKLQGNPVCSRRNELNIVQFCGSQPEDIEPPFSNNATVTVTCLQQSCPTSNNYQYVPDAPGPCFCAAPLGIGLRLRSPSISDFRPYFSQFKSYLATNLKLELYQVMIDTFMWEEGPRLKIFVKVFPPYSNTTFELNITERARVMRVFARFEMASNGTFGPYDLLSFSLLGPYKEVTELSSSGKSRAKLFGIVIGAAAAVVAISLIIAFIFFTKQRRYRKEISRRRRVPKMPVKTEAVKAFSFVELEAVTQGFSITRQVGQGGYGKVYQGTLSDGTVVAVKRAQEGSLQGQKEFFTEIEFLSRLHHRNLVSLVGFCNEQKEQMLVYEFMPNGSLRDLLSARFRRDVSFSMRMRIALGSAKGILYLHTEADPPIIHRDIKANNILLDIKYTPKVSDFGISKLAAVQDCEGAPTQTSTGVKGTPGYLDPDYFNTQKLTEKSDVYSLGIVFLELLTGMPPISHGRFIVREVLAACDSGKLLFIIDQNMGGYPSECMEKFMKLALKCCEDSREKRPTMLQVVRELENILGMLEETGTTALDSDAEGSTAPMSDADLPPPYIRNTRFMSSDYHGSDLVSDIIPTIRPR